MAHEPARFFWVRQPWAPTCCREHRAAQNPARELHADVAIIGGGVGGVAAALAAARAGRRVILSEENGLDRRPAHPASRAPRRASLDRVVRLYGLLSPLSQRRPRLLSSSLPAHDRGHGPRVFESRQWLSLQNWPRAPRGPGGFSNRCWRPFVSSAEFAFCAFTKPSRRPRIETTCVR